MRARVAGIGLLGLLGCQKILGIEEVAPRPATPIVTDGSVPDTPTSDGAKPTSVVTFARRFGEVGNDRAIAVRFVDEDMIVVGDFQGRALFDPFEVSVPSGQNGLFVARIAPNGNAVWARSISCNSAINARDVAVSKTGDVVVYFRFTSKAIADTKILDSDNTDVAIARYKGDGTFVSARKLGGPGNQDANHIVMIKDGRLAITGTYDTTADLGGGPLPAAGGALSLVFVAVLDAEGNHVASRMFGDPALGTEHAVVEADVALGNLYVAGRLNGSVDLGSGSETTDGVDAFFATLDLNSATLVTKRSKLFRAAQYQAVDAIANDVAGNVWLGGNMAGCVKFGTEPTCANVSDGFVATWAPLGEHLGAERFGGALPASKTDVRALATQRGVDDKDRWAMAGVFQGTVDFGLGAKNADGTQAYFVAGLGAERKPSWMYVVRGEVEKAAPGIAISATGAVAIVGTFGATVDVEGTKLEGKGATDGFYARLVP